MYSHIFIGISDFDRALSFYGPLMDNLQLKLRFCDRNRPWAGWQKTGEDRPLFLIGRPFDDHPHNSGNGQMTAFLAASRSIVDDAHRAAISCGGRNAGDPGLRPEYHANYYGAYFYDPDGNKICVACHDANG